MNRRGFFKGVLEALLAVVAAKLGFKPKPSVCGIECESTLTMDNTGPLTIEDLRRARDVILASGVSRKEHIRIVPLHELEFWREYYGHYGHVDE